MNRPHRDKQRNGEAGTVRGMTPEPEKDTTRVHIPDEVMAQMEEDYRRHREYACIESLDKIRLEHGIGWAIYCSAFMGRDVDVWRVEICEALDG